MLKFSVDTGAKNNFISKFLSSNYIQLKNPVSVPGSPRQPREYSVGTSVMIHSSYSMSYQD